MSDIGSENLRLSSSKLCVEHNVSDSEMNVGNKRRKVSFSTPVAMESENPEAHLEPVVMKRKRTSRHSFKGKLKEETVPEQKRAAKDEDAGSEIDCWRKKIKKKCDIREARLIQKQEEQCQEFHQIWGKKRSDLERDYKLELSIIRFIYGEGKTRTDNKLKLLDGIFEKKLKEHNLLEDMEFKNLKAEHLTAMDEERQKKEHWLACLYGEPKTDDGPESLHLHSEEVGRDISKSLSTDPQNDLGAAFSQTSVLAGVEQFCALPASSESIPGEIRVVELNKEVPPEVPMDYASPVELSSSTSNKGIDTGDAIGVPDALVNLGDETDEAVGLPPVEQILNPPEQTKASWTAHHCTSLLPQASEDPIPCSSISDIIQDIGAQVNPVEEQSIQVIENQIASPFEVAASGHVDTVTVAESDIELHDQDVADALQDQDATDLEDQTTPLIEVANSVNPVQSNIGAPLVPSCNQLPFIEVESQSHNLERRSSQTAEIADNRDWDLLSNHFGVGSGRISSQTGEITDAILLSHESTSQLGGNRELQSIGSESQVIHESSFEASASSRNNGNVSQIVANTVQLQHQAGLQLGIPGNLYGSGNQFSHHQITSFSSPLQHELGKISKEIEQLQKSHEDMKSQLRSDCEKEIQEILAQINSKYDLKHQEAGAEFSHKRNGLEKNRNIVLMNKLLAESFSSSFRDLSWLRGIQQAAPSSNMHNQTLHPLVRPPPMAMNHHPVLGQPITTANIQQLLLSNPTRHPPITPAPLQTPQNAPAFSFASSSQPLRPSPLHTPQNAIQQLLLSNPTRHTPITPSHLQPPPNAPAFSFASSYQPLRPLLINSITPTPNSRYGGNVRSGAPHLQPYAASFMPTPTVPSTFQHSQTLPPPPSTFQNRPQHQVEPPALLNPPSSAPTHMDDRPNITASLRLPQINSSFGSLEQSHLARLRNVQGNSGDDDEYTPSDLDLFSEDDGDELEAEEEMMETEENFGLHAADLGVTLAEMGEDDDLTPLGPSYSEYVRDCPLAPPVQPKRPYKKAENNKTENAAGGVASIMTPEKLARLRVRFEVPQDVYFWAPAEDERADQPPAGCVAVSLGIMEAGLRFPLHPAISALLAEWRLSITQIMPNGWSNIIGILTLFGLEDRVVRRPNPPILLTPTEISHFLVAIISGAKEGGIGWYAVKAHPKNKIIEHVPNKIKNWQSQWWFVGGDWRSADIERGLDARLDIPCDFSEGRKVAGPSERSLSQHFRYLEWRTYTIRRNFHNRTCKTLNTAENRRLSGLLTRPHHLGQTPPPALVAITHPFPSEDQLEKMVKDNVAKKKEIMVERIRLEKERKAKTGLDSPAVAQAPATKRPATTDVEKWLRKKRQTPPTGVVQALEATHPQTITGSPSHVPRDKRVAPSPTRDPADKTFLGWEPSRANKTLKDKVYRAPFVEDYMCSNEVNIEDSLPDFLAHATSDIGRSWTKDLHEFAEKQDCYDNMRSAIVHSARSVAFLAKTSNQLSQFQTVMMRKNREALEAKKSADYEAKEAKAEAEEVKKKIEKADKTIKSLSANLDRAEKKITILEAGLVIQNSALDKEREEVIRLKAATTSDANYAYVLAYIDAIRAVLKADVNADISGPKADLEEYMLANPMADETAFDAKDLERKGIIFPANVVLLEPEDDEEEVGGEKDGAHDEVGGEEAMDETTDVGDQAEKDDVAP